VQPVDLAATLASALGVTQPSASVGKVLTQAIHPLPALPPARAGRRRSGTSDETAPKGSPTSP
jgi:hypothetical protein